MKTSIAIALGLTLSATLAACGKQSERQNADEGVTAAVYDAETLAMPSEVKHGKATGTVTAIDAATGQVTLDHGAIAELQWPPMTMAFAAKPELLKDVKAGDKVAFELDWNGKAGTITKLDKEP